MEMYEIALNSVAAYLLGFERCVVCADNKQQAISIAKEKYGIQPDDIYVIYPIH